MAHASGPLGDASSFNAFIFGNYSAASDSEGAIAAGGSITGSQNTNMHQFQGTLGTTGNIGVYGGLGSNLGGNLQKGNVYLQGGSYTGNNNGHGSINIGANATLSGAFAADETYLKGVSKAIKNLAGYDFNVDYTHNNGNDALFHYGAGQTLDLHTHNNLQFNVSALTANLVTHGVDIYVLNISASELSTLNANANNIEFDGLDATHNLYINVIGDGTHGVTWSPQQQTNSGNQYTLYNFVNTPTVTTNQLFTGSILATGSKVIQGNGDIQGNVIANGLEQHNELHFDAGNGVYHGYVPPAAVPEPAPIAALGMGALLVLRRRKKS